MVSLVGFEWTGNPPSGGRPRGENQGFVGAPATNLQAKHGQLASGAGMEVRVALYSFLVGCFLGCSGEGGTKLICCFFDIVVFASIFGREQAPHYTAPVFRSTASSAAFLLFPLELPSSFCWFGLLLTCAYQTTRPKTLFRSRVAGKLTRPPASVPSNHGLALSIK